MRLLLPALLLTVPLSLPAQLQKTYTLKFDPAGSILGEYRILAEKKLTKYEYLFNKTSYFKLDEGPRFEGPNANKFDDNEGVFASVGGAVETFFTSDKNKFYNASFGFIFRNVEEDNELLRGPVVRLGLRQYFLTEDSPQGFFVYGGVVYNYLFADLTLPDQAEVEDQFHRPGVSLSVGYQYLAGPKRRYALELQAGAEYFADIRQNGTGPEAFDYQNVNNLNVFVGLAVRFAFRQKNREW